MRREQDLYMCHGRKAAVCSMKKTKKKIALENTAFTLTTNFSPVSQPTFPVLAVRHRRIWVNIPSSRSRHITPARHFHGLGTLSGVGSAPAQLIQRHAQRHARQGRHDDCAEIQEHQPRGSNKDYLAAFDYFARISTVLGAGGGGEG
jgi:hypothetical protein